MIRRVALTVATLALLLAGCGVAIDTPGVTAHASGAATIAPTASPAPPIVPVPSAGDPTNRMTGVYPAHCTARTDAAGHWHPDPICTPGLVRRDITDQGPHPNIATTICVPGYTSNPANPGARPPDSNTEPVKRAAMRAYGMVVTPPVEHTTEGDHLIPLELGGMNATENYAPEPSDEPGKGIANTKDGVERALHTAVCSGRVHLADAQTAIAADWTTAEGRLGLVAPR